MNTPHPTVEFENARQYVGRVPHEWTAAYRIPVPFIYLETLAQAGDLEMKVQPLLGANQQPRGSMHFFRRIRLNTRSTS